jgi:hypothetical protein
MVKQTDAHLIALEWLKQIITLSSGIIIFSGTLVGTIVDKPNWSFYILGLSWLLFLPAIIFSLETISTIISSRIHDDTSWTQGAGRRMGAITKICFVGGIILFVIFATINIIIIAL